MRPISKHKHVRLAATWFLTPPSSQCPDCESRNSSRRALQVTKRQDTLQPGQLQAQSTTFQRSSSVAHFQGIEADLKHEVVMTTIIGKNKLALLVVSALGVSETVVLNDTGKVSMVQVKVAHKIRHIC